MWQLNTSRYPFLSLHVCQASEIFQLLKRVYVNERTGNGPWIESIYSFITIAMRFFHETRSSYPVVNQFWVCEQHEFMLLCAIEFVCPAQWSSPMILEIIVMKWLGLGYWMNACWSKFLPWQWNAVLLNGMNETAVRVNQDSAHVLMASNANNGMVWYYPTSSNSHHSHYSIELGSTVAQLAYTSWTTRICNSLGITYMMVFNTALTR